MRATRAPQAQLRTDIEAMPIEVASVRRPEDQSPYVTVVRISVAPRAACNDARPAEDDRLSFSPWRGIAEHGPLGSVMRARKKAYKASAEYRVRHKSCPVSGA